MEFPFLDMTTSVFSSARDKDLKSFSLLPTLPDSSGGSRDFVFSQEPLTDLRLSRISPGFLKNNPENTRISPGFLRNNPENNFTQAYLSIFEF